MSACASRAPELEAQEGRAYERRLLLQPALDLSTQQLRDQRWLERVLKQTQAHLDPLKLTLTLAPPRPWSALTDRERGYTLSALLSELMTHFTESSTPSLREESPSQGSTQGSDSAQKSALSQPSRELWLGINSFHPPSYPTLNNLALSRPEAPVVLLRRLHGVSGVSQKEAERAMSRLLARALGANLGAIEGCEPDVMSLSRDELLGWRSRGSEAAEQPPQRPEQHPRGALNNTNSTRTLPMSAPSSPRASQSIRARGAEVSQAQLKPVTWSALNQALIQLTLSGRGLKESACERLALIDLSCEVSLAQARLYTHSCLQSPEAWREALKRGALSPEGWEEERELARALSLSLEERWPEALKACAPLASRAPTSPAALCAATAAERLNKGEEATRYVRAYLSGHPLHPRATLLLSKLTGKAGDHKAAEAQLRELLSAQGERLSAEERARAHYNLGVALAQQGRWREAIEQWRAVPEGAKEHERAQALILEGEARP